MSTRLRVAPEHRDLSELMNACERFLRVLARHGIACWADFGTLLGARRHRNIIPWDYDVDLAMMHDDYARLLALFAEHGGSIDGLTLDPDYYGERASCCFVSLGDTKTAELGIDVVAYAREGAMVRSLMSPQLLADYPSPYDVAASCLLPLRHELFLGQRLGVFHDTEARLVEVFGADWMSYPAGHVPSAVTSSPFVGHGSCGAPRTADGASRALWWAVAPSDAERAGLTLEVMEKMSFHTLVLVSERALWGCVHVAESQAEFAPEWLAWRPSQGA